MSDDENQRSWLAGRRNDVERIVGETCHRAIASVRGMLAEEIRSLSRRVERMHSLLDQLEHLVEAGEDEAGKKKSTPNDGNETTALSGD